MMGKVFLLAMLLLGCGGASDYSDAELLADSERRIESSHNSYQLRRTNGGLIVSSAKASNASLAADFQLTLSPAEGVLLTGQLFSAVIYSLTSANPKNNVLALYDNHGLIHGQRLLAQWRTHGNIFAITVKKQSSHLYADLFFLNSALHGRVSGLGGYAQGSAVQRHELGIAYSGKKLALAYRDRKEGIDMVVNSELHQEQELVDLETLVVNSNGEVMHHLQGKDIRLNALNDKYSRLYLPKLTCEDGDLVLIRIAGRNHVHESGCHLIK